MTPTLLLALLIPAADPTPEQRAKADTAIHKYLAAQTERLSKTPFDGATTKAEWEKKRPELKQQFLDMMGLWPLPDKTPLKAIVTGELERSNVVIENVHFQSKPGLYVTGNLYRPKVNDKKLPAILYVCGHSGRGRDGNKVAFQDHGLWFASNGYVCLVVDTLQLGEVAGKHHGTYNLDRFWWQTRGYTPAGVECWNGIRAIDYLISRPDVDADKIGVTGISGGGATTVWMAAADDRVKVAVPVSGMSDLESYVSNKVINGHCDCMFYVNTYQWEWTTALALFAPKPLLFANSDNDPIFPMDGNRRIIARLRKLYEMVGSKDNVDEYVSVGGHDYRPDLRIAIFGFFNQHLKGDKTPVKDADFAKIEGKELRVFPEDKDMPKDSINATMDETFVTKADVKIPEKKEEFAAWKAGLVKQLREKSFRALPEKVLAAKGKFPEAPGVTTLATEGDLAAFAATLEVSLPGKITTLVVINVDEDPIRASARVRSLFLEDNFRVLGLAPRGSFDQRWTRKNPPNTVERSLALLGQTVDSGRVLDILAVLSAEPSITRIVATDRAAGLAIYAALFSAGQVKELILDNSPTSHRDGPHFLNIDRVLDLPTAMGLLAPDVKLTLVNSKDKAFDRTEAIYKLAGGKFERK